MSTRSFSKVKAATIELIYQSSLSAAPHHTSHFASKCDMANIVLFASHMNTDAALFSCLQKQYDYGYLGLCKGVAGQACSERVGKVAHEFCSFVGCMEAWGGC